MEVGLHQRAAPLLVVAEVAGALRRVGLDDHADGGHAREAHDVVGAGLDAVQRPLDRRARGVEVAGAALELGAQGAHDAEELRLVDVDARRRRRRRGARGRGPRRPAESELGVAQGEVHERRAGDGPGVGQVAFGVGPVAGVQRDLGLDGADHEL